MTPLISCQTRAVPETGTSVPLLGRTGLDQAHARKSYLGRETVDRLRVAAGDAEHQRGDTTGQQ